MNTLKTVSTIWTATQTQAWPNKKLLYMSQLLEIHYLLQNSDTKHPHLLKKNLLITRRVWTQRMKEWIIRKPEKMPKPLFRKTSKPKKRISMSNEDCLSKLSINAYVVTHYATNCEGNFLRLPYYRNGGELHRMPFSIILSLGWLVKILK